VNGVLLFAATDKAHDTELWRGASSALAPSSLSSVFAVGTGENVVATVATYARDGSLVPGDTLTPFGSTFAGGIRPAIADFNGDGTADIAVASGPGIAAEVIVFDGATGQKLFDTQPFGATFTGGLYISAGDIDNDGKAELVVTPDVSGGPRVTVFKGGTFTVLADFLGIDDSNFRGGCRTAVGDVDGDGFSDIVVAAGFGGGPRVSIFKGGFLLHSQFTHVVPDFFMFENTLRNGIYVAVGDINGDGKAEVIGGGGPGGGPRVLVLDGATLVNQGSVAAIAAPVDNFFAGNVNNRGGIRLTTKDLDLDDRADLVTGDGADSGSHVTVYLGSSLGTGDHTTKYLDYDAYPGLTSGVFVG